MGANNIRGIGVGIDVASETGTGTQSGNALFIVDGLPRDISTLRMSEVESISVLKDASAAVLYGTQAVNGVIMITTKRGFEGKSQAHVNFNYGIKSPIELPSYMNSADYMTWYNQARINDRLDPLYSDEDIEHYRSGNPYRYPSIDYYSDQWLRKFKNYYDINAEFRGGNKMAKYYVNAGWNSAGSLIDFGQWSKASNNALNVRTNVDLKINDWINTEVDATALFRDNKTGRGNFWNTAYTTRPNLYSPFIPIDLIDPENSLLLAHKNDVDGKYLFGGTTSYTSSIFSNGYAGGSTTCISI
jgi:TonB-dependent SusC/RagA subfamily outer membrane receptor